LSLKRNSILSYIILGILVVLFIFPIYWMFLTSFKQLNQAFTTIPQWIFKPTLKNYYTVFVERQFYLKVINSLIVGLSATLFVLTIASSISYTYSRYQLRGSKQILFWILSLRIIPPIVSIVPVYILFKSLGFLDTYRGLIVIYTYMNLPLAVWLLLGFFKDIPLEIEESAQIDGCSRFGIFFRVVLPLVTPGLVAAGILSFIFCWNEFLFASILSGSTRISTGPVGLYEYATPVSMLWGHIATAGSIMIAPIAIIAIIVQKHMVRGLTMGAVKG
jgi:multiple sugar transport system permease protein